MSRNCPVRTKLGTKPAFCQLAIESSGMPDEERNCTDREQVVSRHGGSQGGINKKTRWILPLRASSVAARAKAPKGRVGCRMAVAMASWRNHKSLRPPLLSRFCCLHRRRRHRALRTSRHVSSKGPLMSLWICNSDEGRKTSVARRVGRMGFKMYIYIGI